jgi:ABC-2 type transport system permease protein
MKKEYKNIKELIWLLAKTDFKLRYQGSVLGYVWAILKPLALFAVLNFVFSSMFNMRGAGNEYYSLELLTGILLFNFFSEGTMSGLMSLVSKGQLVTKIYMPRWILVLASTLNSFFIFLTNIIVLAIFFIIKGKMPSIEGVLMFLGFTVLLYMLVVAFSFLAAPLYVRFRDLSMIWEVLLSIIMYASPIIYPLTLVPAHIQKLLLLSPVGFLIYFAKQGLISNHFPTAVQGLCFAGLIILVLFLSILLFRKTSRVIAEYL